MTTFKVCGKDEITRTVRVEHGYNKVGKFMVFANFYYHTDECLNARRKIRMLMSGTVNDQDNIRFIGYGGGICSWAVEGQLGTDFEFFPTSEGIPWECEVTIIPVSNTPEPRIVYPEIISIEESQTWSGHLNPKS